MKVVVITIQWFIGLRFNTKRNEKDKIPYKKRRFSWSIVNKDFHISCVMPSAGFASMPPTPDPDSVRVNARQKNFNANRIKTALLD